MSEGIGTSGEEEKGNEAFGELIMNSTRILLPETVALMSMEQEIIQEFILKGEGITSKEELNKARSNPKDKEEKEVLEKLYIKEGEMFFWKSLSFAEIETEDELLEVFPNFVQMLGIVSESSRPEGQVLELIKRKNNQISPEKVGSFSNGLVRTDLQKTTIPGISANLSLWGCTYDGEENIKINESTKRSVGLEIKV